MRTVLLKNTNQPLVQKNLPCPEPEDNELLVKVTACAVCRTDLHIKDGELPPPKLPLILGHQIVGVVEKVGGDVTFFKKGDRVGIPWLAKSCGKCAYCSEGKENLCDQAQFTGYDRHGGFAEYTTCLADYAIALPCADLLDAEIAPLLCGGLIGFRAYRKAAPSERLGLYGFGSSAHIISQIALHEKKKVYAFTRDGDKATQEFARSLGCEWAGSSSSPPPEPLDAAIIFAPVGELVPISLKALKKGGRCVCAGIHMSDIPSFAYKDLWEERSIHSVANLTRQDAKEFFTLLPQLSIKPKITLYALEEANKALEDLRAGTFQGSAVLKL